MASERRGENFMEQGGVSTIVKKDSKCKILAKSYKNIKINLSKISLEMLNKQIFAWGRGQNENFSQILVLSFLKWP